MRMLNMYSGATRWAFCALVAASLLPAGLLPTTAFAQEEVPPDAEVVPDDGFRSREDTYETGRGIGMGGGGRANAQGTSAVAYNPANISLGRVYHMEANLGYAAGQSAWSTGASVADSVSNQIIMVSVLRVAQPFIIWPASILALIGIYLLSGGDLASLNSGDILIIICALFWAAHVILTGRVGQKTDLPVTMATLQFFVTSFLALLGFGIASILGLGESLPSANQLIGALPEILFAGLIAGGLGFTLQAVGQRYTSESAAAVLISTESLFAALFGAMFLGERLQHLGYIGCGLIFVAILMVELMPRKAEAKPAE